MVVMFNIMRKNEYNTFENVSYCLLDLTPHEYVLFDEMLSIYMQRPTWEEFARAWIRRGRDLEWSKGKIGVGSPIYRICQDLEMRLGISEGRIALPEGYTKDSILELSAG